MIMDPLWATQQVHGPKSAFSKLMNLSDMPLQVDGFPMHFTLFLKYSINSIKNLPNIFFDSQKIYLILPLAKSYVTFSPPC
jgi:hypothetical protein